MRWLVVTLLVAAACSGGKTKKKEPPSPCPYDDPKRCEDQPYQPYERDRPEGRPTID